MYLLSISSQLTFSSVLSPYVKKAVTLECKQKVEHDYMRYLRSFAGETPFPFEDVFFYSQCKKIEHKYQVIGRL